MFERYTESARRTLFFARGAAIELGSALIEPDHVLLAAMRELRAAENQLAFVIDQHGRLSEKMATMKWDAALTVGEIPFGPATKKVLICAMHEADDLHQAHIGPEHLLLGVLRGDEAMAEQMKRDGVTLERIRTLAAESNRQS